jgi:hypothetical protein
MADGFFFGHLLAPIPNYCYRCGIGAGVETQGFFVFTMASIELTAHPRQQQFKIHRFSDIVQPQIYLYFVMQD